MANEFAEVSNWTENTKSRYLGGVCKHFLWLENNGYYDLQKIDGDVIQRYFIYLLDAGCCGRTILNTKVEHKRIFVLVSALLQLLFLFDQNTETRHFVFNALADFELLAQGR